MNKKTILLVIFLNIILSLHAETVFVYIEKGDIKVNDYAKDNSLIWVNSIENGIMDSFFESGHIVFSGNSGKIEVKDFEKLNQLAKSGGASIMVAATLNFNIKNENLNTSGEYCVYNLFTDDIIYKGNYSFDDVFKNNPTFIEDKLFSAGQILGNSVVKSIF